MKIIRFTALWCADCIVMRPVWQKILSKHPDLVVSDYDYDDDQEEVAKYNIARVPTTLIINDDNVVISKLEGMQDEADIESFIKIS